MGEEHYSAQRVLQREILSYLEQHPDAKDTVEGIMHWWLPAGDTRVRTSDVSTALEVLVRQGWLTASIPGPSPRVYGLERARHHDIRKWLEN